MDNYELKIFLNNLDRVSKQALIRMIEDKDLSAENIADIILHFSRKLEKIMNISYLYYDLDYKSED